VKVYVRSLPETFTSLLLFGTVLLKKEVMILQKTPAYFFRIMIFRSSKSIPHLFVCKVLVIMLYGGGKFPKVIALSVITLELGRGIPLHPQSSKPFTKGSRMPPEKRAKP